MTKPKRRPANLKTLSSRDYPRITLMVSKGLRERDVARELGMGLDAWLRIRDEDERANEAWEEGRGDEHAALVGRLFEIAMGNTSGAPAAAMFLLKCRHGYREAAPVADRDHRVRVEVVLPGALQPAQYERIIEAHPKAIKAGERGTQRD